MELRLICYLVSEARALIQKNLHHTYVTLLEKDCGVHDKLPPAGDGSAKEKDLNSTSERCAAILTFPVHIFAHCHQKVDNLERKCCEGYFADIYD